MLANGSVTQVVDLQPAVHLMKLNLTASSYPSGLPRSELRCSVGDVLVPTVSTTSSSSDKL